MARLNRKRAEAMVELDHDAAMALIHRHLDEYEWILERTWHEQTVSKLKEEIDALVALNPDRVDAVALKGELDAQSHQIEQARFALGAHLPVEPQVQSMARDFDDDDDWDDTRDDVIEEIGFVDDAAKALIRRHEPEYRKIVESIDLNNLHQRIASLEGQLAKRESDIRKLKMLNPKSVNVPVLTEQANGYVREIERLGAALEKKKRRK